MRIGLVILLGMVAGCAPDGSTATTPTTDMAPMTPGADMGAPPQPFSCEPTMDWQPHDFTGAPDVYVAVRSDGQPGDGTQANPYANLQQAIDAAPMGAVLHLGAGSFEANPAAYTDPTCGNCTPSDPKTPAASRGFVINKPLALVGAGADATTLVTHAGYGVFIEDACEVRLADLAITGGTRDADGAASDGAVFVRRSRTVLNAVTIRDNTQLLPNRGYPGIAGVMCREQSDVLILGSTINNNSWDGISVYQDGHLRLFASTVRKGNGVGVGSTWNGRALVVNNDISGYWKGIGAFVNSFVVAHNNVVHDNVGWGMWVTQQGHLEAINNTIAYNDQLGVYLADTTTSGTFVNNLVAYNGMNRVKAYPPDTFGEAGVRGLVATMNPLQLAYNDIFGNQTSDWVAGDGKTVIASNAWGDTLVSLDPMLTSATTLTPTSASPLFHAGDPQRLNADGSRSDIGATGGPDASRTGP